MVSLLSSVCLKFVLLRLPRISRWQCEGPYLIEDMRRFVSFVNWHLTFLLEHSEQLVVSVASH